MSAEAFHKLKEVFEDAEKRFEEGRYDTEVEHARLDDALVEYVDAEDIKRIWEKLERWYA